jgi:AraC-like DNA-binding protein
MTTIIEIIIYAGIVQGLYMALLLNHNKKQNTANTYLAVLLVMMSISIVHSEFVISEVHKNLIDPYKIREPFLMLVIPLIWFYVRKLENPGLRFSAHSLMHFLPFLVFMSINIPAYFHGSTSTMALFLHNHSLLFNGAIWSVLLIQYSVYLFQIIRLTHNYNDKAEQELSNIEKVDISWLKTFLVAFILVFILLAIMFAGVIHQFNVDWLTKTVSVVFSISTFVLGYKGIFQRGIFSSSETKDNFETLLFSPENKKTRVVDEELKNRLLHFMENSKPYREPELTLTSLAKQINMGRNQLSEIINSSMECNFYDFINRFRVEDVKEKLTQSSNQNFTLLAIAFDAGFPSKSTFNTVFKKFTGLTPSEYKKGLL